MSSIPRSYEEWVGRPRPEVRPHPEGGHTVAVPVPNTITARVYVGQFDTPQKALEAARDLGRREGEMMLAQLRATRVA